MKRDEAVCTRKTLSIKTNKMQKTCPSVDDKNYAFREKGPVLAAQNSERDHKKKLVSSMRNLPVRRLVGRRVFGWWGPDGLRDEVEVDGLEDRGWAASALGVACSGGRRYLDLDRCPREHAQQPSSEVWVLEEPKARLVEVRSLRCTRTCWVRGTRVARAHSKPRTPQRIITFLFWRMESVIGHYHHGISVLSKRKWRLPLPNFSFTCCCIKLECVIRQV